MGKLVSNLALTLILILCKRASLRSISFCEEAKTDCILRRSEEADPRSEDANSRFINFCELTLDLRMLTLGLRELTIMLRKLTLDFI